MEERGRASIGIYLFLCGLYNAGERSLLAELRERAVRQDDERRDRLAILFSVTSPEGLDAEARALSVAAGAEMPEWPEALADKL